MKGFINAKTYIRGKGIVRANIGIEGDKIVSVDASPDEIRELAPTGDCLLVPGFIDEHIHGAGGADTMDGTADALKTISDTLVKEGTTSFLATTMTQEKEKIISALKNVAAFENSCGARLLGAHLEGPFISPEHIGAQPCEYISAPSVNLFEQYNSAAGNKIKIVTLAPEEEGGEELIKYLSANGIVASVGHSDATHDVIKRQTENGLSCVTHTYNAQRPIHHRELGVTGSALLYEVLACEVIADTVHVSVPALQLLIKNKPADKIVLITDAMRAKGAKGGVSELGGQTVYVKDGEARLSDGTLAGSVLKMNEAVKNIVLKCGVSIENALDYATFNPAKNIGIEDEYGIIKPGAAADFTLLDDNFNVRLTVVGGNIVYKA